MMLSTSLLAPSAAAISRTALSSSLVEPDVGGAAQPYVFAGGGGDQHRAVRIGGGDVVEDGQRVRVGPVQVFEEQGGIQRAEQAQDGLAEDDGRVDARFGYGVDVRRQPAQRGKIWPQLGAVGKLF